ncbi:MAG: DUF2103 domain-containing protein [Pseudomonadota bacterium]
MKYRKNSKIKREHSMIEGLEKRLQEIESWPEVSSITAGVITPRKGTSKFDITVQYPTETGLKLLAKHQGSVQEVFLVTPSPDVVAARVSDLYSLDRFPGVKQ